jgi:hypothetical protein
LPEIAMLANQGFELPLIFGEQSCIVRVGCPSYHVAVRRQSPSASNIAGKEGRDGGLLILTMSHLTSASFGVVSAQC